MKCSQCDEPTFGKLCVYCRGERVRPPTTVMTQQEWGERIMDVVPMAKALVRAAEAEGIPLGVSVLAYMVAARSLVEAAPGLPSFEWYAKHVSEFAMFKKKN